MEKFDLQSLIAYYRTQGAPADPQMLLALLREAQEADEGALSQNTLERIAEEYHLKETTLLALIRRMPGLHLSETPHSLEICGTCPLGRSLREYVEKEYHIKSGDACREGGFSYRVTGCMKNCKNGPSVRWDGTLHPRATLEELKNLLAAAKTNRR